MQVREESGILGKNHGETKRCAGRAEDDAQERKHSPEVSVTYQEHPQPVMPTMNPHCV